MTSIIQDVPYAVRSLRRPLLAAAAIASLALGIGVNTAIMFLAAALRRAMRVEPVAALRLD
jgi:hypothetical protein